MNIIVFIFTQPLFIFRNCQYEYQQDALLVIKKHTNDLALALP